IARGHGTHAAPRRVLVHAQAVWLVRYALVVSDASREGTRARGLGGIVPAPLATTADGARSGWNDADTGKSAPIRAAALVRNALVVSAGRSHRDAAADDTGHHANGHDTPSATHAARLRASAAGHVFCLTSLEKDALRRRDWSHGAVNSAL